MGPGISLTLWPPKLYGVIYTVDTKHAVIVCVPVRNSGTTQWTRNIFEGQALGLLVPVGYVHYCLLPPAYQPSSLLGALPGYPVGNLILKRASRLDAFSGYHFRT